jgi:hypothetical protein
MFDNFEPTPNDDNFEKAAILAARLALFCGKDETISPPIFLTALTILLDAGLNTAVKTEQDFNGAVTRVTNCLEWKGR